MLAFSGATLKVSRPLFMQAQDALTAYLLKSWTWAEANRKRLIAGAGIIIALIVVASYFSWQREQQNIAAGEALTQVALSAPASPGGNGMADEFLSVAGKYADTMAAQRAQLSAATALFVANQFSAAQAQFQKYLDAHPDGAFAATATLGVAACQEALGQLDQAANTYQRVNGFADLNPGVSAKFALARIDEEQGKFNDALQWYVEIARLIPNSPAAQEAQMRAVDLKTRLASVKPATPAPKS